jgi:hypothetical protein
MTRPTDPTDRPLRGVLTLLRTTLRAAVRGRSVQRVRIARPVVTRLPADEPHTRIRYWDDR